jgi:uncharacterized membrane protein YedE/YeeE
VKSIESTGDIEMQNHYLSIRRTATTIGRRPSNGRPACRAFPADTVIAPEHRARSARQANDLIEQVNMSAKTLDPSLTHVKRAWVFDRRTVGIGAGLSCLLAIYLAGTFGWRQAALFLVGVGAGLVLYHAAFGFTGAWRDMISQTRGAGLRAQMLMLALTVTVFVPLLAGGELWSVSLRGSVAPLGLSVLAGAFMFGVGMQLGGACASGTLFTVGGGNVRMIATLGGFIAGSVFGAWHWSAWQDVPSFGAISLLERYGVAGALAVSLMLCSAVWLGSLALERRRHGNLANRAPRKPSRSWWQGPWPLLVGALGLAAVNFATLALAGRPWGITSGFALWGSKAVAALGFHVDSWAYWQRPGAAAALDGSVFGNVTSIMDFGILLGALSAAGLAGRFAPSWRLPPRSLAAAVLGGLLLGYGARIAHGCNIGAYFSGIASTSLHGWAWFVAAFAGNAVGVRLRPLFGLAEPGAKFAA